MCRPTEYPPCAEIEAEIESLRRFEEAARFSEAVKGGRREVRLVVDDFYRRYSSGILQRIMVKALEPRYQAMAELRLLVARESAEFDGNGDRL